LEYKDGIRTKTKSKVTDRYHQGDPKKLGTALGGSRIILDFGFATVRLGSVQVLDYGIIG